jgi:hypothetical protein
MMTPNKAVKIPVLTLVKLQGSCSEQSPEHRASTNNKIRRRVDEGGGGGEGLPRQLLDEMAGRSSDLADPTRYPQG